MEPPENEKKVTPLVGQMGNVALPFLTSSAGVPLQYKTRSSQISEITGMSLFSFLSLFFSFCLV